MEILKGKEERSHEVNRFTSHIGNPVVRDLNKIADKNKSLRRAAESLNFHEWKDSDGSSFETYGELLDYQIERYAKRYPPVFVKDYYPELIEIKKEGEKKVIGWNLQALKIFRRNHDEWYKFSRVMDETVLRLSGYDPERDPYKDHWEEALEKALDDIAIKIHNLQNADKNNSTD